MKKVGAITVGQAPRVDVTFDIEPLIMSEIQLFELGALDGLSKDDISKLKPESESDYVLVSRLTDGSSVTFAEKYILPRMQDAIYLLEEKGVELIVFFCSGEFDYDFKSNVPLLYPSLIQLNCIPYLTSEPITVVVPSDLQLTQIKEKFSVLKGDIRLIVANPYDGIESFKKAFAPIEKVVSDLIVLDCIGYTIEMKSYLENMYGQKVVTAREMAAYGMLHYSNDSFEMYQNISNILL